jgi:hypothetical protein
MWIEKELICDIIYFFESIGFDYVENLCWVMLDSSKKESVDATR